MTPPNANPSDINRVAGIALIGASIEWYDFFLYGIAAALIFPKLFFPSTLSPALALIAAFGTFSVGFVARPLGGMIFGHFGDKAGRKTAFVVALVLMGLATTMIGLLPTYSSIGVLAPILLIVARLTQGLALGGQWAGAVLLVTETAPPHRRGFYGSFAQAGSPLGMLLANVAILSFSAALSEAEFLEWGWRLPFIFSIVLIGLALYVKTYLEDTPSFRRLAEAKAQRDAELSRVSAAPVNYPVWEAITKFPKEIMLAAGAMMGLSMALYIAVTYAVAYGTSLQIPRNDMLAAVLIGALLMVPAIMVSGAISDRYGRRGIYLAGAILLGIWAFALFPMIDTRDFVLVTVAISLGLVFVGMGYGPQAAFFAEMFSTQVRYSGASLGYQIGTVLGGAISPLVAAALLAQYGTTTAISIYMAVVCGLTALCVLTLKETFRTEADKR